jgi:uncharacterized protein (DUF362 family)
MHNSLNLPINFNRREWISTALGTAAALSVPGRALAEPPTAPVAIAQCRSYGAELMPAMQKMFDQLGGLGRIVAGKTVAMKINLTGSPKQRLGHMPAELAQYTHPAVIGTTIHLMHKAGARRVRLLESPWSTTDPLEEYMMDANWDPSLMLNAGGIVEMENTNYLGAGNEYHKFTVPNGGHTFKEFWLNHSYADTDVFVSIAKMKEHATAGITLGMKNLFGITPCTIYGDGAGENEPSIAPRGGRGSVFHSGRRPPSRSVAAENDPSSPRDDKYRIPRIVADIVAAVPVHLTVIDGVETMARGEGPWIQGCFHIKPGLLAAGTNIVTTDAVGSALMGYDPMAERGTPPYLNRDSTLKLAEMHGVGTRDLKRIEVVGGRIEDMKFDFKAARRS